VCLAEVVEQHTAKEVAAEVRVYPIIRSYLSDTLSTSHAIHSVSPLVNIFY